MKHSKRQSHTRWFVFLLTVWFVVMAAVCGILFLNGLRTLFTIFAVVTAAVGIASVVMIRRRQQAVTDLYAAALKNVSDPASDLFRQLSLPMVLLSGLSPVWYNSLFLTNVLRGEDALLELPEPLYSETVQSALRTSGKAEAEYRQKYYEIYKSDYIRNDQSFTALFFVDVTEARQIKTSFENSRGVVMLIAVDSYEGITADMRDSTKAVLKGAIDREVEALASSVSCINKKLKNNRYFIVLDEAGFDHLKNDRFSILDRVRGLSLPDDVKVTLSIGVGRGFDTLKQCETAALKALEMSQGRGGDQAAVNCDGAYEFFGGVSNNSVETHSKVRPRVIASALKELIDGSDRVFLMGHHFGDNDSLASCYALWNSARLAGKPAQIVVDPSTHLAGSLLQKIREEANDPQVFTTAEQAIPLVSHNTLLIICDTHRRDFLEAPELYDRCETVVMIDHHRKNIDFIRDTVIFYHEPYASSCSEMVTEVLQYMSPEAIGRSQADGLLSGIMLDTNRFVLRTGVRTFEAIAFLRGRGADPVAVKELFADSIDVYKERTALVSDARFVEHYAIAIPRQGTTVSRIAASQAADELLGIEGVYASFVMSPINGGINISARSLGKVNVQLIMEALGGGGHHTMAACQVETDSFEDAFDRLLQAIQKTSGKDESI